MALTTTLKALRKAGACERGYNLIAAHVGEEFTGDIPLSTILEVNGMADTIWALRAAIGGAQIAATFAKQCADRVKSFKNRRADAAAYAAAYDAAYDAERKAQASLLLALIR